MVIVALKFFFFTGKGREGRVEREGERRDG